MRTPSENFHTTLPKLPCQVEFENLTKEEEERRFMKAVWYVLTFVPLAERHSTKTSND
jgi:hypothetical protein